ncbi:MAG: Aminopeptidase YpdF [Fimbriimonadaceae bacterium]|nr:Aminopeptidase YpdF [Fimbriimonadaceae bacterium]
MSNLVRVREAMEREGIDALLVTDLGMVQWLTGFTGSYGMVALTPSEGVFVSDSRYTIQAGEEVAGVEVAITSSPQKPLDLMAERVQKLGIEKLACDSRTTTFDTWRQWEEKFRPATIMPSPDILTPLRMIKSVDEIEKIQKACGIADACMQHAYRMVQPGVREYDILLEIEFFIRRQGAALAFEPIVVSGHRSARPHGHASEKKLEPGDFVTLDLGANLDGYNSDITRTVVVGKASDRHRRIYELVLEAEQTAIKALVPGANGKDVDQLARDVLDRENLSQYFGHGLGHGLGKSVHDFGRLAAGADQPIAVGQVWTVEPGVYIEGFGGCRIEDDVWVTSEGPSVLTHVDRSLLELP